MAKGKNKKKRALKAGAPAAAANGSDEEADVAATRAAAKPVIAAGASHYRLASAAGAHPADMKGFLEGKVSLTWAVRKRLRDALPNITNETPH